ncbi:extracellular solute-binding protein [Pelagicoccus sp. SDUM812003]|uniref:extracellular solute-binding protein n=1 Tax=Pelagicoccus sp. SDUM812003 TaxID=3041267 RepID=UPI00280E01BD|nr:extracellular solute-binding protein [Pelagicoccus sp. SDUM812003]MDQ8202753.1 extracellular solute-binding protein [Pelagicoccus sp. SDUM812003]
MFRSQFFRNRLTIHFLTLFLTAVFAANATRGGTVVPSEDWEDDYDPIASPDAVVGGEVKIALGPYPSSFNAITNYTYQSITVFNLLFDTLMDNDPISLEWRPKIADKIEVSDDKLEFTVYLNPNARWSDGEPITSADFKFTLDTIMDPNNIVGPWRNAYQEFEDPVIIDDHTFSIRATELHWRNLNAIAGFVLLPKHYFQGKDFNKQNFEFPVVSGRYELVEIKEGISIRFDRRDDWWLEDQKRYQGVSNFQSIEYRFYPDRELVFESFMKGEVDLFTQLTATIWSERAKGEPFEKNWIVKQAVYNKEPVPYQGFAINMRRAPYDDKRVRQALCHLLDRERINETMMHGHYFLLQSYATELYGEDNPNPNPAYDFNPEKARKLLAEAGWKVDPSDGKLKKDGKPFVINFLLRAPEWSKYLVVYQEALKDVGIDMEIKMTDWAGWTKEMDEFNFEMTLEAWGVPVFRDPEGAWHSKQANEKGGNNHSGLQSPEVDALIEKQKSVFDVSERNDILRQIDAIVYDEVPMVLAWMVDYKRLFYWNKFGMPDTVLDKYNDEEAAYHYWWIDPDQEADLENAMATGEALPPRPSKVYFEEMYHGE